MIALYIKDYAVDGTEEKDIGHTVAYAMLDTLYRAKFNTPTPIIEKNEYGKPYFVDGSCHFSISHGKGLCAVLLTDEGECGVDIEPEIEENRAKKINTRFLSDRLPVRPLKRDIELRHELTGGVNTQEPKLSGEVEIQELEVCGAEGLTTTAKWTVIEVESFDKMPITAKWTVLEAVLKMSGGGFGDYPQADALLSEARTASFRFKVDKDEYVISIAI